MIPSLLPIDPLEPIQITWNNCTNITTTNMEINSIHTHNFTTIGRQYILNFVPKGLISRLLFRLLITFSQLKVISIWRNGIILGGLQNSSKFDKEFAWIEYFPDKFTLEIKLKYPSHNTSTTNNQFNYSKLLTPIIQVIIFKLFQYFHNSI